LTPTGRADPIPIPAGSGRCCLCCRVAGPG
jgi:hypothetical protein